MFAKYHYDNNYTLNPKILNDLLLYQLGEMMCESGAVISSHIHLDWYEFTYVISGKGIAYTNNKETPIKEGDLYFSHPKEIHKMLADPVEPMRYFFCAFNFNEDSKFKALIEKSRIITADESRRVQKASELNVYFQHLLSEIKNASELSNMLLEHELKTVILKVLIKYMAEKSEKYLAPKSDSVQLLCFNIINYIDNNIASMQKVSCLAEVFGYNYSYLSRIFKKITNESINDYFSNKKLAMAKEILESGEMNVTETANYLHYSSIYVFSSAFKKKYKISPVAVRQKALMNKNGKQA